ncbi:MAG: Tryptophan synthase alpha chain [Labilithrix sp.]|nr:Tryptophan synthase alpha chain [Labilithrix sp.]
MRLFFSRLCAASITVFAASAVASACAEPNFEVEEEEPPAPLPDRVIPPGGDAANDGGKDAADGATDAAGEAGDGAPRTLHAFVSSTVANANLGGLAGADARCTALGTAQGLTGSFRAWLSVPGTNAADRVTGAGPWLRADGQVAVASRAELLGGTLARSLEYDEKGTKAPSAEDRVWTATAPNGSYDGPDCAQWTSGSGGQDGLVGEAEYADDRWTKSTVEQCSQVNRIYCFEQP